MLFSLPQISNCVWITSLGSSIGDRGVSVGGGPHVCVCAYCTRTVRVLKAAQSECGCAAGCHGHTVPSVVRAIAVCRLSQEGRLASPVRSLPAIIPAASSKRSPRPQQRTAHSPACRDASAVQQRPPETQPRGACPSPPVEGLRAIISPAAARTRE